jgi:SSS family solute:Na+ symporter
MRVGVTVIVGLYFAALIGWSLYNFVKSYRRGGESEESRYVGARSFGTGALVATLVAAWASNYTLLAAAESGYNFGISGPIWYALGVGLPLLLFVWPVNLIAKIREAMPEGVTIIEYVGSRYDPKTRLISLVVVLIASLLYIISVVLAIGIVLSSLLGISSTTAIAVGGTVLIVYTALGGFEATVRSHVYQLAIAGLGVTVALILTAREVGLSQFVANIPQDSLNVLGWGPLGMLDFFLVITAFTIASPVIWQRLFAAGDTRAATHAVWWFPLVWMPFAVGAGIMGMAATRLLPDINPSSAATELVVNLFPSWAAILFLLGGLALIFSSGDAAINNVASIVQIDILDNYLGLSLSRRQNLYLSFALQIGLGMVGIVGALFTESILALLVLNSAINLSLLLPLYLGLVWMGAHRTAAFWSILLSLGVGGALIAAGQGPRANLVALLVSAAIFVGLSYLLRAREGATGEPAEGTERTAKGVPGVVVGVAVTIAAYVALYVLASVFAEAVLRIPAATMYPLYAYAFVGCVAMVLVLPVLVLRADKRGDVR